MLSLCYRHQVVEYYSRRSRGNFRLIESFNLIGRTSEMARLYGIEFYNVLSRGSQVSCIYGLLQFLRVFVNQQQLGATLV